MTQSTLNLLTRGIATGESMSPMNADYRVYALPPKRVNRVRILSLLSDNDRTTNIPRPFTHAAPPATLHPGPGESLEWFAFSARQHSHDQGLTDWEKLAQLEADPDRGLRVRIGTKLALQNLRNGSRPPQSGHDNAHYFDDIATVRALAAVAVHGTAGAVEAARADASVTHSLDGVWCAAATAALFGALLDGTDTSSAIQLALEELPENTWSRRMAIASLDAVENATGPLDRARRLSVTVGDWIYSYPITAPETFGFLVAHLSRATSAEDLLLSAYAQPRNGATLPALTGAAAAIVFGDEWIPAGLDAETLTLTGLSVPPLKGLTVRQVIEKDHL